MEEHTSAVSNYVILSHKRTIFTKNTLPSIEFLNGTGYVLMTLYLIISNILSSRGRHDDRPTSE